MSQVDGEVPHNDGASMLPKAGGFGAVDEKEEEEVRCRGQGHGTCCAAVKVVGLKGGADDMIMMQLVLFEF